MACLRSTATRGAQITPMTDVVIAGAARTAIGSYGRSLKDTAPSDLGATASKAAIERAGLQPDDVGHVVFGNVIHTEPGDMYMARVVGMKSGIPKETPAYTVNRLCGTGVQAIVSAAQTIQTGEASIALAGGAESMSRGQYWMPGARWGARMGDAPLVDAVVGALTDPFDKDHMGITAERLAERGDDLPRAPGRVRRRVAPPRGASPRGGPLQGPDRPRRGQGQARHGRRSTQDEHIREEIDAAAMGKLRPAFRGDGTVTAGNASGLNDAGAAVVLMSEHRGREARRARARPDPRLRLVRRRPADHGDRPRARHAQGAGARRPLARRGRRDRAERGVRRASRSP